MRNPVSVLQGYVCQKFSSEVTLHAKYSLRWYISQSALSGRYDRICTS